MKRLHPFNSGCARTCSRVMNIDGYTRPVSKTCFARSPPLASADPATARRNAVAEEFVQHDGDPRRAGLRMRDVHERRHRGFGGQPAEKSGEHGGFCNPSDTGVTSCGDVAIGRLK